MLNKTSLKVATAVAVTGPILALPASAQQRQLSVYSSLDEDQAEALIKAFEAKHPDVKVNAIIGSTAPTIARVIAEVEPSSRCDHGQRRLGAYGR